MCPRGLKVYINPGHLEPTLNTSLRCPDRQVKMDATFLNSPFPQIQTHFSWIWP